MNKLSVFVGVVYLLLGNTIFAQDARRIYDDASKAIEFNSFEMVSTLNIHDGKGNVRSRQVANATRKFGSVTKSMIKFLAPAEVRGTALLIFDYDDKSDDMWIFLPSLRKSRRIISSEKGKSFMGSEFSNADMSKPNIDDFVYKLIGSEMLNGKECWVIESKPKNNQVEDENGFARKVLFIEKATNLTIQSDYYDFDGRKFKTLTFGDYRKQSNGKYFAFRMEMKNLLNNRYSEIVVNEFQLSTKLDENQFSVSMLEK